jgi:hypothetical protein
MSTGSRNKQRRFPVQEVIDLTTSGAKFCVTSRYVHRVAEEMRDAYRAAFGRKGYSVTVRPAHPQPGVRVLRIVAQAPGNPYHTTTRDA